MIASLNTVSRGAARHDGEVVETGRQLQIALNASNADGGRSYLTLSWNALEAGETYTFAMRATNYFGEEDSDTFVVKKLAIPAPSLSIQVGSVGGTRCLLCRTERQNG